MRVYLDSCCGCFILHAALFTPLLNMIRDNDCDCRLSAALDISWNQILNSNPTESRFPETSRLGHIWRLPRVVLGMMQMTGMSVWRTRATRRL